MVRIKECLIYLCMYKVANIIGSGVSKPHTSQTSYDRPCTTNKHENEYLTSAIHRIVLARRIDDKDYCSPLYGHRIVLDVMINQWCRLLSFLYGFRIVQTITYITDLIIIMVVG